MPARTGRQYLNGLREQEREVWLAGERVRDVTSHPGLKNGARAIAALYDMQCDPKSCDEMTYISPTTGDRVGLSFIVPAPCRSWNNGIVKGIAENRYAAASSTPGRVNRPGPTDAPRRDSSR